MGKSEEAIRIRKNRILELKGSEANNKGKTILSGLGTFVLTGLTKYLYDASSALRGLASGMSRITEDVHFMDWYVHTYKSWVDANPFFRWLISYPKPPASGWDVFSRVMDPVDRVFWGNLKAMVPYATELGKNIDHAATILHYLSNATDIAIGVGAALTANYGIKWYRNRKEIKKLNEELDCIRLYQEINE